MTSRHSLATLLAEHSALVIDGFEDWFDQAVKRSERHYRYKRETSSTLAQHGITARSLVIMQAYCLAFSPWDSLLRQPHLNPAGTARMSGPIQQVYLQMSETAY